MVVTAVVAVVNVVVVTDVVVVEVEVLVVEVVVDVDDVVLVVVVIDVVDVVTDVELLVVLVVVSVVVVVTQTSDEFFTVNITQYGSDCNLSLIHEEKRNIATTKTSEESYLVYATIHNCCDPT